MKEPHQKVLAIDYGTVRIGLAVSFASLADPLTIIPNNDQSLQYIARLINQHGIKRVVVGLSENTMAAKTKAFVLELNRILKIPVELFDETLTSQTVRKKLRQSGKKNQAPIDHLAAAEILQNWLDEKSSAKQIIV